MFAVRCSLFAVRCSLFASVPKDTDFQRLMQISKRTIHNVFFYFLSLTNVENYHTSSKYSEIFTQGIKPF